MTGEHFDEWFRDKLLPNVPPNSLIVMDNASYHSRLFQEIPTKSWLKTKMIDWLVYYDVPFPNHALKSELFAIKQSQNITRKYIVDEMAKEEGHEVVHLPVAHCT